MTSTTRPFVQAAPSQQVLRVLRTTARQWGMCMVLPLSRATAPVQQPSKTDVPCARHTACDKAAA